MTTTNLPEPAYYIVKETAGSPNIRFFIIGYFINGKFTGMMSDYTGGGNFEEIMVHDDKFIPTDRDDDPIEWDEQTDNWEILSGLSYIELETTIYEVVDYDTELFQHTLNKEYDDMTDDRCFIQNCSLVIPYGLGNTGFIDGYEIT